MGFIFFLGPYLVTLDQPVAVTHRFDIRVEPLFSSSRLFEIVPDLTSVDSSSSEQSEELPVTDQLSPS